MAPWDNAPWAGTYVVGATGQGASQIGFTEPATQSSVTVPGAAGDAPPEAGEGPLWDAGDLDFGMPGTGGLEDSTPYEPPGVAPGVDWDAPPWVTEKARSADHGASAFFNSLPRPQTGLMRTIDRLIGSWAWGIETDNLGNTVLTDINRPEHDISQVVDRDLSNRWIGYEERPLFLNVANPAPVVAGQNPGQATPDGTYPDLSNRGFAAQQYVSPPDPVVTDGTGTATYEPQGEWE
jgi:hypothetical protein